MFVWQIYFLGVLGGESFWFRLVRVRIEEFRNSGISLFGLLSFLLILLILSKFLSLTANPSISQSANPSIHDKILSRQVVQIRGPPATR